MIPPEARPHEVGILIAYLVLGVKTPKALKEMFHYDEPQPVYRVLRKYRQFLSQRETYTRTLTVS